MSSRRSSKNRPKVALAGQVTRGKTARNRLRRVDRFLCEYDRACLERQDGSLFVDLGYGASPVTTLDSVRLFRSINPGLRCVGIEIDPERVAAAKPFESPGLEFRLGGFNLPLEAGEQVRLIRAFNVLRQYDEAAVRDACLQMSEALLPGGILLEGTSDPFGRVWTAWVHRKKGVDLRPEVLVLGTNFKAGFDPELFQAVLPKALIHRLVPGEPIHELFSAWHRATRATIATRVFGPRQWWRASLEVLAGEERGIRRRPRDWSSGWAVIDASELAAD